MIYETYSEEETFLLGKKIGENAKGGEIYCLDGDLGAGKTVFSKGFAKGLGITEHITSPTFTIINEYRDCGRLNFYHFDVYRLSDPEELYELGYDEYFYGNGVCLVEWAELIKDFLPEGVITIRITESPDRGEDYRKIEVFI